MNLRLNTAIRRREGQATTELVIILPLFVLLAGAFLAVAYYCWQGIKLQQAANLAARIQGQERVSGGVSRNAINAYNTGTNAFGTSNFGSSSTRSVFDRASAGVSAILGTQSSAKSFRLSPVQMGMNTDQVKVSMSLLGGSRGSGVFNGRIPGVDMEAVAYGGEDPFMYALPRWGPTSANPSWTGGAGSNQQGTGAYWEALQRRANEGANSIRNNDRGVRGYTGG